MKSLKGMLSLHTVEESKKESTDNSIEIKNVKHSDDKSDNSRQIKNGEIKLIN